MKQYVGADALVASPRGTAVAIGTFDGVHLGHRALIARTVAEGNQSGLDSAVVTWDRHPAATLRPDKVPPMLSSPQRKIELLGERGLDVLAVIPFDKELSKWSPERFVDEVIVRLGARHVFVGEGWRFGHKAVGDVALLKELGRSRGFEVDAVHLETASGEAVSSTRIRGLVTEGDLEYACELLGRPFDFDGPVIHGDARGKSLGYPTANIDVDPDLVHPPRGVYAGRARVGDIWYPAAINVGVNPTFGGDPATTPIRIEAFLLDFEGDLYAQTLRVEFWKRLRDELRFDGAKDLVAQMERDVADTRDLIVR